MIKTQTTENVESSNDPCNHFEGALSGAIYDRLASLTGFGPRLYQRAAMEIPLGRGMCVLDLGCGTASFGLAIAERIGAGGQIHGLDISERQLAHARRKVNGLETSFEFHQCSMGELSFKDATFDAVVSSLAFHAVPPQVRRDALRETARVLKPRGLFALVDLSKPRLGWVTLVWLPSLLFEPDKENWNNVYPALCKEQGLYLDKDLYLNSLVRCQVFHEEAQTCKHN